jgi:hypothetical protein
MPGHAILSMHDRIYLHREFSTLTVKIIMGNGCPQIRDRLISRPSAGSLILAGDVTTHNALLHLPLGQEDRDEKKFPS